MSCPTFSDKPFVFEPNTQYAFFVVPTWVNEYWGPESWGWGSGAVGTIIKSIVTTTW
jgi:hypothetical protein